MQYDIQNMNTVFADVSNHFEITIFHSEINIHFTIENIVIEVFSWKREVLESNASIL